MKYSGMIPLVVLCGLCAGTGLGQNATNQALPRFEFRQPGRVLYEVELPISTSPVPRQAGEANHLWAKAWVNSDYTYSVELGSRVVLVLEKPELLAAILDETPLRVARSVSDNVFILQAADVSIALREAEKLAKRTGVTACYPVSRRPFKLHQSYSPRPNDPYFFLAGRPNAEWQPYLENRDGDGKRLGGDLNVRAAWPWSRGEGIVIAIADDGIDLGHPDLKGPSGGAPHFNFYRSRADGQPSGSTSNHGTAVAGLAAAAGNNGTGIAGVAPDAKLASWVIFDASDALVLSDETLMDMFQYRSNVVSVQNHSWGKANVTAQIKPGLLEDIGISNAVTFGRSGKGVVMVRAAGNEREMIVDSNDDGYTADARSVAVAAVRLDGKVASYSNTGACILVGAFSGDDDQVQSRNPCLTDSPNIMTTDRRGTLGYNRGSFTNDLADYAFGASGFSGTSASCPQISGLAALILGANTNLSYRDVQQILIHSARQLDPGDTSLQTNQAGFVVSHNVGFGVPDAGLAVRLARHWPNRPSVTNIVYSSTNVSEVPDLGLRLHIQGAHVPDNLNSIVALSSLGPHPELVEGNLELVDVGRATSPVTQDLRGKVALIQRGENFFCEKVKMAADAGAVFAVIYNNEGTDTRMVMGATDFIPIPAAFIAQQDGEQLAELLGAEPGTRLSVDLNRAEYSFDVTETLVCEHIGVRVDTNHSRRGDLRIVLTSPSGTRSILQRMNADNGFGPSDWTFYSVQHFYESSAGRWTVSLLDEDDKGTGNVLGIDLIVKGVSITDTDHDGLDDDWERHHWGALDHGPQEDKDRDGFSNAREQIMGTDPAQANLPLELNITAWDQRLARLSWPGSTNAVYSVSAGGNISGALATVTNLAGAFPETEWFTPYTNLLQQFYRIEAQPRATP